MLKSGLLGKLEVAARERRHSLFLQLIASSGKTRSILDVGGTVAYWQSADFLPEGCRVVLLNMFSQQAHPDLEVAVGDARDLSRFADQSFDVVFSNSVIGHVGGLADQERMAREIRRVGRHFFVQTPNHGFPLDWRTLVPLFHFLPTKVQAWCFLRLRIGKYTKARDAAEAWDWAVRIRNVRRSELSLLFPGATVVDERVMGFAKSFMIHNFPTPVDARSTAPATADFRAS